MNAVEYPHPVLQNDGLDYTETCAFDLVFNDDDQAISGDQIVIKAGYRLDCPGLSELISNDSAAVCLVVHSPAASFRRSYPFPSDGTDVVVRINKYEVIEKVEVYCQIVATSKIPSFHLPEFNPLFFEKAYFSIERGALLGITDKVVLYIDDSELMGKVESIFRINRVPEQDKWINPDFSDPTGKIAINLKPELHDLYSNLDKGYSKSMRRSITCAIVLPVLVEAIETLFQAGGEIDDCRWARVIGSRLEKMGVDLGNKQDSSVMLADELLGGIVNGTLASFEGLLDETINHEDEQGGVD